MVRKFLNTSDEPFHNELDPDKTVSTSGKEANVQVDAKPNELSTGGNLW